MLNHTQLTELLRLAQDEVKRRPDMQNFWHQITDEIHHEIRRAKHAEATAKERNRRKQSRRTQRGPII